MDHAHRGSQVYRGPCERPPIGVRIKLEPVVRTIEMVNFSMAYASRTAQTLKRGGYVTGILRFGCTWRFCAPLFDACKTYLSE